MSVSYCLVGIMEPDEKFNKMYAAFKACRDIGCKIPDEVLDFFNGEYPSSCEGMEVRLELSESNSGDYSIIGEINVSDIPESVKKIQLKCY